MRRIYFVGLILYTLIVLHVAFPETFSLAYVKTIHIALFIFGLFVVDCCISLWLSQKQKKQETEDKKEIERKKRKRSFWMTTYCFSLAVIAAFVSEHIPLERLDIKFSAIVFTCYFFFHFIPYMKEKRGEEEDPVEREAREQENKRVEEEIKQLGKQKWYLKSKLVYILCFITPPIGYIYVLLLRKKMMKDAKDTYLVVATLMMGLWSLKFLPSYLYAIVIIIVACLVFIGKYVK
ncbi:WVD2 family protein [Bacillus gaemokensis]|uniref:Membrane protein n=1 Tax=Bacillus gaemokensis TaxID=574375 RepID=A0A073K3E1_9BACI|nr:WVD2 family protein [Bacillus gaemokensis]KEK21834.1 membrane protein [Bacillus gaemokensis]KYG39537.1 hypothetical protein AZF08_04670 [Bacillus gaemokensis]